jgi:hypothetical protein
LLAGLTLLLFLVWYFVFFHQYRSSLEAVWDGVLNNRSATLIAVGRNSLNYDPHLATDPNSTLDSNSISASHHMDANTLSFSEARALVRLFGYWTNKRSNTTYCRRVKRLLPTFDKVQRSFSEG